MKVSKCCDEPVADADRLLYEEFTLIDPTPRDGILFYECPCGSIWGYDDLVEV